MNKDQQKEIIESLCSTLKTTMLNNLKKFPESWDQFEFRQYINDKAQQLNYIKMTRTRMRNYKDDISSYNL